MSMTNMSALLPKSSLTTCTSELCCDKILVENNLSNEKLMRVQCLIQKKSGRQDLEAAVHSVSAARKQREMNTGVNSLSS